MMLLHQELVQIEYYFDAQEYKLALNQCKKVKKLIKKLRRKSK